MAVARSVAVSFAFADLGPQLTRVSGPDGHQDLANVNTCDKAVRLAPGATHSRLQSIGSCATQPVKLLGHSLKARGIGLCSFC